MILHAETKPKANSKSKKKAKRVGKKQNYKNLISNNGNKKHQNKSHNVPFVIIPKNP